MLPADADRILLGAGDVSDIVGAKLQLDADRNRPIAGASAAPACSAPDAVGMAAFVGDSWSRFHVLLFTDGDRHEQVVASRRRLSGPVGCGIGVLGGTGAARACDGQRALGTGSDAAWSSRLPTSTRTRCAGANSRSAFRSPGSVTGRRGCATTPCCRRWHVRTTIPAAPTSRGSPTVCRPASGNCPTTETVGGRPGVRRAGFSSCGSARSAVPYSGPNGLNAQLLCSFLQLGDVQPS